MSTNPILAAFAGAVALVNPAQQARFESCVSIAAAHMAKHETELSADRMDADADWWGQPGTFRAAMRPYVVVDGVLQIPVKGVLLHDFPYSFGAWATGYDYIWRAFERGMGDLNVQGIALVCDTPGGQVAGCFDCVDRMFALKAEVKKPVRGFASESAYSAGYALISVCDKITVSRTGGVGSVGVVTSHVDLSAMMDKAGVKVTFIYAGKHKVDGNPYNPLDADAEARIQARIDETYEVFVSTVARNRPALSEDEVRATEALCYTANQALSVKFADNIGALDDALADYTADLSCVDDDEDEGDEMTDKTISAADHEVAVASARTEGHTAGRSEGHAAGLTEGATAERTRITAILGRDEAKERPAAALAMALDDAALTPDSAGRVLGKLPKESAPAASADGGASFADAMNRGDNPNLGTGEGGGGDAAAQDGSDVLAIVRGVGLGGFKPAASA